uniref:SP1-Abd-9 n=1 Tax=Abdopus aculeatus TaxID=515833 RepID=R4G2B9_ABDAC
MYTLLSVLYLVTILSQTSAKPPITHIVDGSPAEECQFPSIVHLTFEVYDGIVECGGTLLSKNHILTAAHCFPEDSYIYGSSVNIGTTNNTVAGQHTTYVKDYAIHTEFSTDPMRNDIAILSLEKPVKFNHCMKAARLPKIGETFTNKRCIAAGWGQTGFNEESSEKLLHVTMPVIDHNECISKMHYASLNEQHICAGDFKTGGASTCMGDSGGPLYCPSSNGKMVVAGITSFGYDCGHDAAIFTNVAHYKRWIKSMMRIM